MTLNDEELDVLAGSRLFARVPRERIREHLKATGEILLRPGAVLLELGQRNATIYLLVSGRLAVHLDQDATVPVAYVEPGECVGEISIIDEEAASASVVAVERARLVLTNPAHLWELMAAEPVVAHNLMQILAERIRRNNAAILASFREQAKLSVESTTDPLTGLHNRRWMNEMFLRQIERCAREGRPACVAMIDIDHFKAVNDNHGHAAGDRVLVQVARIVSQQFRPGDLAVRYGGEEFTVLLPGATLAETMGAAERFREAVGDSPVGIGDDRRLRVTASVGVAQWTSGMSLDNVVSAADRALYQAKQGGRNRVVATPAA